MNPATGEIREFEKPEAVPEGWVPLKVGSFIEATIEGRPMVFVIRKVTKKDLVLRLRVTETAELRARTGR